jgi:hypothetical protein
MAISSLLGSYIDQTYPRLVQTSGSEFADGLGNPISIGISGGTDTYIPLWSGSNALTSSFLNQSGSVLKTTSASIDKGLSLDFANEKYTLGDYNSTKIVINDTSSSISLSGSVSITGSFNDGIPKLILTGITDTVGTLTYNTVVNTLGDTFTFTATNGVYELTMDTATPFTSGYTYVMFSTGLPGPGAGNVYNTPYEYVSNSIIKFYVKKDDNPYGGVLRQATIEIRVYPPS